MHQLGVAKRAIKAFTHLISGKADDESAPTSTLKTGSLAAIESIGNLGRVYGGYLSPVSQVEIFQEQSLENLFLFPQRRRAMHMLVS